MKPQIIELLAPAKNLECGIAAVNHGADAVYIGAPHFGARAAAGNSIDDIRELTRYAHIFGVKVYVTVNTIIYENELEECRQLLNDLSDVGVDAILVQDMSLIECIGTSSSLIFHASTQTDNRSVEKVRWLRDLGFKRVVLARELSAEEIAEIHREVPGVELEVFVHGALCVSFSGVCYASQYCFGRSANRGECAQFCRLKFDLVDAENRVIERQRHLLSLKDLCQYDSLEQLMEAGAMSFKIEGRLKDVGYVKNVTAAYSQRLNDIIQRSNGRYKRASKGFVTYSFTPDLNKTFNRGFTHYFLTCHRNEKGGLDGRNAMVFSPDTPKALGEYVGKVKEIKGRSFTVAGLATFANGDGLCFFSHDTEGEHLEGFRVNRVEGNRLFPHNMPKSLRKGMALYRNQDQQFERVLTGNTAERKIPIDIVLKAIDCGYMLMMGDVSVTVKMEKQVAQKPQRDNIVRQLTKLGGTPFVCREMSLEPSAFNFFVPSSVLNEMRRKATDRLLNAETVSHLCSHVDDIKHSERPLVEDIRMDVPQSDVERCFPYLYNIANPLARQFYERHGLHQTSSALELQSGSSIEEPLLMQCRHCLKFSLGACVAHGGKRPSWHEPLFLRLSDGRRFRLQFDCQHCQMNVYGSK